MLNEMFVKLSLLREPNMKMSTLVVYTGPLSFAIVMPVSTWKFDTIHRALCHHNSSHILHEMFVKLSILQDPNMKMCTLVGYPSPLSLPLLCFFVFCLRQFTMRFVITTPPTCLMRCL